MREIALVIFFLAITGCSGSTEKSECTDLNYDGWPDIIFSQTQDQGSYLIDSWAYLGSPDGYSISQRLNLSTIGAMGVAVGDLNKDGCPDVVFASVQDGTSRERQGISGWLQPASVNNAPDRLQPRDLSIEAPFDFQWL